MYLHDYKAHRSLLYLSNTEIRVTQALLEKKKKVVTDRIPYTCNFCSEVIEGRRHFLEHCDVVHDKRDEKVGEDLLKCMVCSKVVKSNSIRLLKLMPLKTLWIS